MDINFNKHFSHGLEFRIFESLPIEDLSSILNIIVYLADFSLDMPLDNPKLSKFWHKLAENCVHNGKGYYIDVYDQNELYQLFNLVYFPKEPLSVCEVLDMIVSHLAEKYKNGVCNQYMIQGKKKIHLESIPEEAVIDSKLEVVNDVIVVKDAPEIREVEKPVVIVEKVAEVVPAIIKKHKFLWCC
jgi:hypothetical protein